MKRKIALVLAAVVAAVSLAGCNDNKELLDKIDELESRLDEKENDNSSTSQEGTTSTSGESSTSNTEEESSSSTPVSSSSSEPESVVPEVTYTQEDIDNSAKWLTINQHNYVVDCSKEATKVVIPDTVIGIGAEAFYNCTNLKEVILPNSVTGIFSGAFLRCTGLTSINIPDSVTVIESNSFRNCTGLKSITVDKSNPNYSSKDGVLYNKDTTSLMICPEGKTGVFNIPNSVTNISNGAFQDCTGLSSITIPDSVTGIFTGAFFGCTGLSSITIPDSVTFIDARAFRDCTGLTSVTIPDSVTYICEDAFDLCGNIYVTYKGKTYDYAHIEDLYKAING